MCTRRFLGSDMVDEGTCDTEPAVVHRSTAGTSAGRFDGGEVGGEGGVAEVEVSRRGDGIAETLNKIRWYQFGDISDAKSWLWSRVGGYRILTAVRVGHTQSNMSAPRATETTRSSG